MTTRIFSLASSCILALTLSIGCGDTDPNSEPSAPPAGHCEELCNHLDEVNRALMCDVDTVGLGETYEVDIPSCVAECNEPFVCMDLIVAYDQCRIAQPSENFSCAPFRDNVPLTNSCQDEASAAFDCQSENL